MAGAAHSMTDGERNGAGKRGFLTGKKRVFEAIRSRV
jgi:hypothetical protein